MSEKHLPEREMQALQREHARLTSQKERCERRGRVLQGFPAIRLAEIEGILVLQQQSKTDLEHALRQEVFPGISRAFLERHGNIVYEGGAQQPSRFLACYKHMHGSAITFVPNQNNLEPIRSFIQQQDAIRNAAQAFLDHPAYGPSDVRYFLESVPTTYDAWTDDERAASKEVIEFEKRIPEICRNNRTLQMFCDYIIQLFQDLKSENAERLTSLFNGAIRHAASCNLRGHGNILFGDNRESDFPQEIEQIMYFLLTSRDERAKEQATKRRTELLREDSLKVHEFLRHAMDTQVPQKGIGILIYGGGHFSSGKKSNALPDDVPRLEQYLESISDTKYVVIEPHHYDINRFRPSS